MDDIVKKSLVKWPNVPYCYGWLGLDARGNWRMRDERSQQLNLPGDKLQHVALRAFIGRNYEADAQGCWFFQNGPQRVYLNLEATPYIVRSDPARQWLLHTDAAMPPIDAAWLTETGELILCSGDIVAQLDDRDFADVLPLLRIDGVAASDDALLAWLEQGQGTLSLQLEGRALAVGRLAHADVAHHFQFVRLPQPPAGKPDAAVPAPP